MQIWNIWLYAPLDSSLPRLQLLLLTAFTLPLQAFSFTFTATTDRLSVVYLFCLLFIFRFFNSWLVWDRHWTLKADLHPEKKTTQLHDSDYQTKFDIIRFGLNSLNFFFCILVLFCFCFASVWFCLVFAIASIYSASYTMLPYRRSLS